MYSLPYYAASVLSSDMSEDNNYRQWFSILESGFLSAGFLEDTVDAGYCQQWLNSMAFGTVISYAGGVSTGSYAPSTSSSQPQYYPNIPMASATYNSSNYWQTYAQPVANNVHYCLGFDAGTLVSTVTPLSYRLGFSTGLTTDIFSWTVEGLTAASPTNPDGNYDWAQSAWTLLDSHVGLTANTTGTIWLSSAPVTTPGTGYVQNTNALIASSVNGRGAVIQPYVISNAIAGHIIVSAGIGYAVNDAITYTTTGTVTVPAVAYVSAVNGAGQITAIVTTTAGAGYVQNPICVNSIINTTVPVFGCFTTAASGVAGGINNVIPSPFSSNAGVITNPTGYSIGTYGTPVISQTGGTGAVIGTPTAIVQSTANIFNIPLPLATTSTQFRAVRLRITANNGSTSYCYCYNWNLYTGANATGTNLNLTPTRLAPTSSGAALTNWKIFYMNDTNSSTCCCYVKVWLGSSGTWNYPAVQLQMGQGTDGAGNLTGSQVTTQMTVQTGTAASMTIQPFWINGYCGGTSAWMHFEFQKGTSGEIVIHLERLSTQLGADDPTQGVALFCETPYASFGSQSQVMPQTGSAPGTETKWGAILGTNSGSVNGPTIQAEPIMARNLGWSYPLRRLFCYENGSGITDGAVESILDSYGNTVQVYAGGKNCTNACQTNTNGRILTKNVSA